MRIILANLPWAKNSRLGVRAGSRWPFTSEPEEDGRIHYIPFPFFLAYAASLLRKNNCEERLIDAIAEGISVQKFIEQVSHYSPGLIVIETSTPSFFNDLNIIQAMHQRLPNCRIALCGPHASVFPEQILGEYGFINYILTGEYEYTLLELVKHLENNLSLEPILGLVYRENSNIRINEPRPASDNLDAFPWPQREELPLYKYNDGFAGLPQPNVQMWASRGCPFSCIYCLWPQVMYKGRRHRKRNPIDVAEEMGYLIKRFNFKAVYFDDDVFNIDRAYVLEICKEIKRRKINIPWAAMARADLMDESLLGTMFESGLYAIKYGIESADQNILNLCRRNMDLTKAYRTIKLTKEIGIKVHLTFCLGLPAETRKTIQETVEFIHDVQPDSLQFSFATPFPGTEYFEYMQKKGNLLSKDWPDYDGNNKCNVRTDDLSRQDLEEIMASLK